MFTIIKNITFENNEGSHALISSDTHTKLGMTCIGTYRPFGLLKIPMSDFTLSA